MSSRITAAAIAAALAVLIFSLVPGDAAAGTCPWADASRPAAERASELLAAMQLSDKVNMVSGQGYVGSGNYAAAAGPNPGSASYIAASANLCLPALVMNDATAGIGDNQTGATAFPDSIGLAASWDPGMALAYGRALGTEAFAKGVNVMLGPGMDIARTPLNGRNFEYAGEDPYLAGRVAGEMVTGIQSEHVIATAKHYALNDQETNRGSDSADVSERTLQEIDLPAFDQAVKAGVGAVMCSYNRINSVYACENPHTLNDVLKGQFGFDGFVMSDWWATHSTVGSATAGMDMEMPAGSFFGSSLQAAVLAGRVPISRLNDMVYRILLSVFRVGVFDHVPAEGAQAAATVATTPASLATSVKVDEAGSVLLKNDGAVLPLDGPSKRIAVIGPAAGAHGAELAAQGYGSGHVPENAPAAGVISPAAAITARAARAGDSVVVADGTATADAVQAASQADYAVVFVTDAEMESVDKPSLDPILGWCSWEWVGTCSYTSVDQNALVAAVAAVNPHTIVVLQAGDPLAMPWIGSVRGVIENWFPGQADGAAIAPILFGDVNPSGKLPITFPAKLSDGPLQSTAQYPGMMLPGDSVGPHSVYSEGLLVGYRWYDAEGIAPLFPFGFGLSYTSFSLSGLRVKPTSDGGAVLRVRLTNTGSRAGADVAQAYVGMPAADGEPPRQLKGFRKAFLRPGESSLLSIALDPAAFSHWDTARRTWIVTPGDYTIAVGDSSRSLPLHAVVEHASQTLAAGVW